MGKILGRERMGGFFRRTRHGLPRTSRSGLMGGLMLGKAKLASSWPSGLLAPLEDLHASNLRWPNTQVKSE